MNERKTNRFKKFLYSQKAAPFVFILPFLITFCVFFFYPVVSAIIMSFQKVNGGNYTFVGLHNYELLRNKIFYKSIQHSVFYTIVTLLLMIPIPLALAYMLNSKLMKLRTIFRSAMFIPALLRFRLSLPTNGTRPHPVTIKRRIKNPEAAYQRVLSHCFSSSVSSFPD